MTQRSFPLWLVRDFLCWLGILFTLPTFAKVLHRIAFAALAENRSIRRSELTLAARLLAEAEAWIRYAVMRRAFKLAGLKVSRVRFQYPGLAATKAALASRARQLNQTFQQIDAAARRTAHRLIRLRAEQGAATTTTTTTPSPRIAFAKTRAVSGHSVRAAAATAAITTTITATRAGLRVRAPPWRHDCRLPIADCLCGPAAENTPVRPTPGNPRLPRPTSPADERPRSASRDRPPSACRRS